MTSGLLLPNPQPDLISIWRASDLLRPQYAAQTPSTRGLNAFFMSNCRSLYVQGDLRIDRLKQWSRFEMHNKQ
jgi:hypothetical protein